MTHEFLLLTVLAACTADAAPATKVYDFSGIRLADPPAPPAAGPASDKRRIRDAVTALRPRLLACAASEPAAGTLGVVFELAGGPDRATSIDAIRFDGDLADRATLTACFREVFSGLSVAAMPEDAVWQVHYPITIGR